MKRLAFFVEGSTEVLFIEKLIRTIAKNENISIDRAQITGGKKKPKDFSIIKAVEPVSEIKYYVLIVNCKGDNQVVTRILEEHEGLKEQLYEKIIGVRDVYPNFKNEDIPAFRVAMQKTLSSLSIPIEIVLSIMEIESIFLGEYTHFEKIDSSITVAAIQSKLGFDPSTDNMEQRTNPALDLAECYALGGKVYEKKYIENKTIEALDFEYLHSQLIHKFDSLSRLVFHINSFFSPAIEETII